jgi:hypothetical protein
VDGDHVVVTHGSGGPGLADEAPAGSAAGGQVRGQHLDRDNAVQLLIESLEDDTHSAAAEHGEHLVMVEAAEGAGLLGRGQEKQGRVARGGRPLA